MKKSLLFLSLAIAGIALAGCSTPQDDVVIYDANSWKEAIPASCQSFNDGCNQCVRTADGQAACTRMFCETYKAPYCTDDQQQTGENTPTPTTGAVDYVGLSVQAAQAQADAAGVPFRVVELDGQEQPVTLDLRAGRINAKVTSGVVTSFTVEEGGNPAQ